MKEIQIENPYNEFSVFYKFRRYLKTTWSIDWNRENNTHTFHSVTIQMSQVVFFAIWEKKGISKFNTTGFLFMRFIDLHRFISISSNSNGCGQRILKNVQLLHNPNLVKPFDIILQRTTHTTIELTSICHWIINE